MPEMIFEKYITKFGLSVGSIEALAKLFKVSFTATAIRMAEVSQNPCIAVLWNNGLHEKSNTLSVSWSLGPRKTNSSAIRFVPVKKQLDTTSAQYKAFVSDDIIISHQSFRHGNLNIPCRVESKKFGYNENKYVISLAFPTNSNI
jgi:hypothetical protein